MKKFEAEGVWLPLFHILSLLLAVLQEKDSFDSDDDGEDEDSGEGSKEASTLAGQKHKSDTVLEGAAKRSSSGGSPGANSAPMPLPNSIGAAFGANSAPTPGPVPITLTPEQTTLPGLSVFQLHVLILWQSLSVYWCP
jgi:hypothetical protein